MKDNQKPEKNTVENFEDNIVALKGEYEAFKRNYPTLTTKAINLDSFFAKDMNGVDEKVKVDIVDYLRDVMALIQRCEDEKHTNEDAFIKSLNQKLQGGFWQSEKNQPSSLSGELLLMKGARLVKALNKGNPVSSRANSARAKKYLAAGIILTILGVAIIAGLAICAALAIPALTAAVPFLAAIAPIAHTILTYAGITYGAVTAISIFAMVPEPILITALLPVLPLIGGLLLINKAKKFSKAPDGLALRLASAYPVLAEKVHYGDEKETNVAKLKKAEEKLQAFLNAKTPPVQQGESELANSADSTYLNQGVGYYQARVEYLVAVKNGKTLPVKPSKDNLLTAKAVNGLSADVINAVQVNDHRDNIDGATKTLKNNLVGTLFANNYHVKHAMKVEAEARATKIAAPRA